MKFPKRYAPRQVSSDLPDQASSPGGPCPHPKRPGPICEAVSGGAAEIAGSSLNPPTVPSLTALPGAVQLSTENPGTTQSVIVFHLIESIEFFK